MPAIVTPHRDHGRASSGDGAATGATLRPVKRMAAVAAIAVLGLVGLLVQTGALAAGGLLLEQAGDPDEDVRTRGRDAVWLGHAWVDGRRTTADVAALAARLRCTGVRDLYVHAGPLADDGSLDPGRRPQARQLLADLRRLAPGVRVSAWLGNVVGDDRLDLADATSRERVVAGAGSVLDEGWDGVHYDLEPLPDGDPGFLDVLEHTRTLTRSRGAVLSVAAEPVEPVLGLHRVADVVRPQWWSTDYLSDVAARVDQVALMSYDTGMPSEVLYRGFVARQARLALSAVPADVDLLIGAPAFHTDDLGHREAAETVAAAVDGARVALADGHADRAAYGVALYADFTATENDWQAYQDRWVRRPPCS
jgi:hypothetical protein